MRCSALLLLLVLAVLPSCTHGEVGEVFTNVYKHKLWGAEGGGSGPGSTYAVTSEFRRQLSTFMLEQNLSSMVDAPCGSFFWQNALVRHLRQRSSNNFTYHGVDVVGSVIEEVKKRHPPEEYPYLSFAHGDITRDVLPFGVDLLWSRDTLQHLSQRNIMAALANFKKANPLWLVIGGYMKDENADIADGSAFYFSPLKPPYSLYPEYIWYETHGKHLFVFNRNQVQNWKLQS